MILCDVCLNYATSENICIAVCDECAKDLDLLERFEPTPHAEIARDLNKRNDRLEAVAVELHKGARSDERCRELAIEIRKAISPNWSR